MVDQLLSRSAFTLIEVLVVVAIIGLFASTILVNIATVRERAVSARIEVELKELERAIFAAQTNARLPLMNITGNNCSDCACRTGTTIRDLPNTDTCVALWEAALTDIAAANGGLFGDTSRFLRDPWGAPYLLDENENEVVTSPCRPDTLRSAGPNSIVGDSDDIAGTVRFFNAGCGS